MLTFFLILQVFLGQDGVRDVEGNELPRLVYVSREKRPGFDHHKKAGAMNALVSIESLLFWFMLNWWSIGLNNLCCDDNYLKVRASAIITNAPYLLNVDCDHYINNSKALREAMCFMMDPQLGKKVCYVQFPQRFDGIDRHDRYSNRNVVFFDVSFVFLYFCMFECFSFSPLVSELLTHQLKTDQHERIGWDPRSNICRNWMCFQKVCTIWI